MARPSVRRERPDASNILSSACVTKDQLSRLQAHNFASNSTIRCEAFLDASVLCREHLRTEPADRLCRSATRPQGHETAHGHSSPTSLCEGWQRGQDRGTQNTSKISPQSKCLTCCRSPAGSQWERVSYILHGNGAD